MLIGPDEKQEFIECSKHCMGDHKIRRWLELSRDFHAEGIDKKELKGQPPTQYELIKLAVYNSLISDLRGGYSEEEL